MTKLLTQENQLPLPRWLPDRLSCRSAQTHPGLMPACHLCLLLRGLPVRLQQLSRPCTLLLSCCLRCCPNDPYWPLHTWSGNPHHTSPQCGARSPIPKSGYRHLKPGLSQQTWDIHWLYRSNTKPRFIFNLNDFDKHKCMGKKNSEQSLIVSGCSFHRQWQPYSCNFLMQWLCKILVVLAYSWFTMLC